MIEEEEKIHHMGYVHELLAANAQCRSWDRKFVVLRSAHLEIFATAPVKYIRLSDKLLQTIFTSKLCMNG